MQCKNQLLRLSMIAMGMFLSAVLHPSDDPVAHWTFDEGEGVTLHDSSVNEFDSDILGATWTDGIIGRALQFDGIDDYIDLSPACSLFDSPDRLQEATISLWFRLDSPPAADDVHAILEIADGSAEWPNVSGLIIEVGHYRDNRKIYFTYYDRGSVILCFDSAFDLEVGRWYHFAAVLGQGYNTGYIDGEELVERQYNFGGSTDTMSLGDIATESVCWVGRGIQACCDQLFHFHGAIDELRIYDRPLSRVEIREHYASILSGPSISFLRGDCNEDEAIDISDAVCMLNWLFLGGATPGCLAVTNVNGDENVDISDASYLLSSLFLGGPAPAAPFPECGPPPVDESLSCETPPAACQLGLRLNINLKKGAKE